MQKELDYWSEFVPGTSLSIMKFTIMHDDLSRRSYQEFESYIRISPVGWFTIMHDDLSRGSYQEFESYIRIAPVGWFHIKKFFPAPHHLVFGYPIDAEENDDITFSSFHQEDNPQYNGVDPFTHLAKALDKKALTGTQVLSPAKNLIEKCVQLLEQIKHQHMCSFLLIVPSSQLFMIKWRLRMNWTLEHLNSKEIIKRLNFHSELEKSFIASHLFGSSLA